MKKLYKLVIAVLGSLIINSSAAFAGDVPTTAWGKQFGFVQEELRISADRFGNCFIAGTTADSLSPSYGGMKDAFVEKFDSSGTSLWTIHIGSHKDDYAYAVATDRDGNCYIAGKTNGIVDTANYGGFDAFLVKINSAGRMVWRHQIGTSSDDEIDFVQTDDSDNCFVTGSTKGNIAGSNAGNLDAFLIKYDGNGALLWQRQYGTWASESGRYIALDKNNTSYMMLLSKEIIKYDSGGSYVGKYQHTLYQARGIMVDDSLNIYIGSTTGVENGASAVLFKYDQDWKLRWQKSFNSGPWTGINHLMMFQDGSGDILVGGCQNWPDCFAFCRRYDVQGNLKWVYQLQDIEAKHTCGQRVATDRNGNFFITGSTRGNLFRTRVNSDEIFLAKVTLNNPSTRVGSNKMTPKEFDLKQNYPNPFNPQTILPFTVSTHGRIRLTVYNTKGEKVKILVDAFKPSGYHTAVWDGTDSNGMKVGTGVYLAELATQYSKQTRRMVLIR